jgi:antitoxin component YwqK of YwqJK toxin-antitoxin module
MMKYRGKSNAIFIFLVCFFLLSACSALLEDTEEDEYYREGKKVSRKEFFRYASNIKGKRIRYVKGSKIAEEEYLGTLPHGKTSYWMNGRKWAEFELKNGKRHGKYIAWHSNGNIGIEKYYKEGDLHGRYRRWHVNGRKEEESFYQDDMLHGKQVRWYPNGQKRCEIHYRDGEMHGKRIVWNENGGKKFEIDYKDGIRQGKWFQWTENGITYGKMIGLYPNGNIFWEEDYKDGKRHGHSLEWYEDGQKKRMTMYSYGKKHGELIKWNRKARLVLHHIYKNGKIIKRKRREKPDYLSFSIGEAELKTIENKVYFTRTVKKKEPVENIRCFDIVEDGKIYAYIKWFNLYREEYYLKIDWIGPDGECFEQNNFIFHPNNPGWNTWHRLKLNNISIPVGTITVRIFLNNRRFKEYRLMCRKAVENTEKEDV